VLSVLNHYGPAKVSFTFHVFPLPYHTFAFLAAQGAQVIKSVNGSDAAVFDYISLIFEHQGEFYSTSQSITQVTDAYATLVAANLPYTKAQFLAGVSGWGSRAGELAGAKLRSARARKLLSRLLACSRARSLSRALACLPQQPPPAARLQMADDNLNELARIHWKYATSRYTTGTPHFLVNGLPVDDQIPDGTAAEWYAMIDPLLPSEL
jgi:hypothetical protein